MKHIRPTRAILAAHALLLVVLCLICYLPGLLSTPPIDRDEARFAQASRQMLESQTFPDEQLDPALHSGGLAVPMVQSKPRLKKPPMVYWLQTASAFAFAGGDALADAIWMYRVPSVLGSIAAVLGVWWLGLRMYDHRAAWLGAAFLGASVVVVFDAHQARSDQLLLGVTTWSMALLWWVLKRAHAGKRVGVWRWLLLWFVVGLGVLTKGLTPMVVLLTLVSMGVLAGRWWAWRAAKPMLGLLVLVAVVAPWVYAVADHVGFETYRSILYDEVIARGQEAKEGHSGPPGYHFLLAGVAFWPASLFAILGVWWGARRAITLGPKGNRWKGRRVGRPAELFLLSWLVPTWVFFEVYSTKLPHYTLPVYPAFALLAARAALASPAIVRRWPARISVVGFAAFGVLAPVAVVVGAAMMPELFPSIWLVAPLALLIVVPTCISTTHVWRGRTRSGAMVALSGIVPLALLVHGLVMPNLTSLSPKIHDSILRLGEDRPIACTGYREDSLVFLTRGSILKLDRDEAFYWLRANKDGLLICRPRDRDGLDDGLVVVETLEGFQFARGSMVTIDIVENARD